MPTYIPKMVNDAIRKQLPKEKINPIALTVEQIRNMKYFGSLNAPENKETNLSQGRKLTPAEQQTSDKKLNEQGKLQAYQKQKEQDAKNLERAAEVAPYVIPGIAQAMWAGVAVDLATNKLSKDKYKSWGDMVDKNTGSGEFIGDLTNPGYYAGAFPKLIGKGLQSTSKYALQKAEPYLIGDKKIPLSSYSPKLNAVEDFEKYKFSGGYNKTKIPITEKSVSRTVDPAMPARSMPIVDIFRLQLPTTKTGQLGYGHKYRSIGGINGLTHIRNNNAIIPPKGSAYNKTGSVYWSQDMPLREYTKDSPYLLRYNEKGDYNFGRGNFDNPTSRKNDPIKFTDDNIDLFVRYPFTSKYKKIGKTEEEIAKSIPIAQAHILEKSARIGVKGALGYYAYKKYNSKQNKK